MVDYVARAEVEIDGTPDEVWDALTDPAQISKYMFGAQVVTDWKEAAQSSGRRVRRREL
jgi:uncharacterized protein YndB with AHSA1/START domain